MSATQGTRAQGVAVTGHDIRSLAVEIVDYINGYTMEFAASPEQHARDYDWVENRLLAASLGGSPEMAPENDAVAVTPHYEIVSWEIPASSRLVITVAAQPLGMTSTFQWYEHTENSYGQGSKRTWWAYSMAGKYSIELREPKVSILTVLVLDHPVLANLAEHFRFPRPSIARCTPDYSASGVDQSPIGPEKVWRCDSCGAEGTSAELDRKHRQDQ